MYRIALCKVLPEPDSTGYQMNYLAGTGYLNLLHSKFFGFLYGMNKESIISNVCCFQQCVVTHYIGL